MAAITKVVIPKSSSGRFGVSRIGGKVNLRYIGLKLPSVRSVLTSITTLFTATALSQDVSLQKVSEDLVPPEVAQAELSDDTSDYHSDESEAQAELEWENEGIRRGISKNRAKAAQLCLENDDLDGRIQQLELDVARGEHLCRTLRRRRSGRTKRLTKSKARSKKAPRKRSHRK